MPKKSTGKMGKGTAFAYVEAIRDKKVRSVKIRTVVRSSIPEARETLKMGMPCYTVGKKMVASIGDYTNRVNLYFPRARNYLPHFLKAPERG
ncbi:MAG TPA: DUF1801 domain-containing protein [Nitrososphaerales archaeon]|nr:DUF1801 domain-containing protein [Nitrososphaerales archaeon]